MVKVELMVQVCINGRPIWRKARQMKRELSHLMTDKEYDRVCAAGIAQLSKEVDASKAKEQVSA